MSVLLSPMYAGCTTEVLAIKEVLISCICPALPSSLKPQRPESRERWSQISKVLTTHEHGEYAGGNRAFAGKTPAKCRGEKERAQDCTSTTVKDGDSFSTGTI